MSVGARIRDQREARNMSQAELARQVGLSAAAVWNWETRGRVPRARALAKVAEALNVPELYLSEGSNGAEPSPSGTATDTQQVPERAPPPPDPGQEGITIAEVLERTRTRIAELTGFSPDRLKLTLTTLS